MTLPWELKKRNARFSNCNLRFPELDWKGSNLIQLKLTAKTFMNISKTTFLSFLHSLRYQPKRKRGENTELETYLKYKLKQISKHNCFLWYEPSQNTKPRIISNIQLTKTAGSKPHKTQSDLNAQFQEPTKETQKNNRQNNVTPSENPKDWQKWWRVQKKNLRAKCE